jgi:hypothetical protein
VPACEHLEWRKPRPLTPFLIQSLPGWLTLVGKSMACLPLLIRHLAPLLVLGALCLCTRGDYIPVVAPAVMSFPAIMPQTVVWAWEEPEDLRAVPASVGVAYLAETVFVGKQAHLPPGASTITVVNRHQPLAVTQEAAVMAVVRVIALPGFQDSASIREQTAAALVEVAHRPGLRALQIDFDATRSQRAFYAAVLGQLRPFMPAAMPLSITALVSWCTASPGPSDWLVSLPIDEAVPMFFRLGGAARSGDDKSGYPIRQPLCRSSIGISTDESWPPLNPRGRVYIFAPRPWTAQQLTALAGIANGHRALALQYSYATTNQYSPNDTGLPTGLKPVTPTASPAEEKLP